MSTTAGEGFGLSMVESMATKTINVFPDNTAIYEILKDGRGILVKSGNNPNNLISCGPIDNNQIRPVTDIHDLVGKLLWVYSHKEQVKEIEENGFNLNITRYVDTFVEEDPIDIKANLKELAELEPEIEKLEKQMDKYLKELGIR
jgi:type I restriction-modification system DNA methylase subunit